MNISGMCRCAAAASVALLAAISSLEAQEAGGSIRGSVTEPGGAPIVGAVATLSPLGRVAETNELGTFVLREVPAGSYTVSVRRLGFATVTTEVSVAGGETVGIDVVLEAEAIALQGLTVIGSREELDQVRLQLREIPGSVVLLEPADLRQTRQANFADVLKFTPGVFAQPRFGAADEMQFSIRGSGLRNNFHLRGVNVLVNGMPYRLADGFTDFESLELLTTDNIQVYKGANALRYGGSTLGGAINLETKTGYTSAPIEAFVQAGSFGFSKAQLASGRVMVDFNYYASYARTDLGGFRDYSGQRRDRLNLHLGQHLTENMDMRFWYMFAYVEENLPGALSEAAFEADDTAADPSNVANRYGRDFQLHHAGLHLRSQLGEGVRLDVAPYFQYRSIIHPIFRVLDQDSRDWGIEARYQDEREIGGRESRFTLGAQWAWGENANRQFQNVGGEPGALAKHQSDMASTLAIYAEEVIGLAGPLKGVLGLRWARDGRELEDYFLTDGDQTDSEDFEAVQPKLGLLYELPAVSGELFANASRMYEPPLLLELNSFTLPGFVDLEPQNAWQFEVGSRGRAAGLEWDVSAYDMRLEDEIININVQPFPGAPFTVPSYRNVPETRHYGVDAGIAYELPGAVFLNGSARDRLGVRLAYTLGKFEYVEDEDYAGNEMPGVPEQFVQAELEYRHPAGWSVKPNVDFAPGSYFVDSANLVRKDGWTTFGARLDYVIDRWNASLFLEGRNLTDERYSPAVAVDDAAGRYFFPADGRAIYAGFRWQPGS